jgi:hypothetical protein
MKKINKSIKKQKLPKIMEIKELSKNKQKEEKHISIFSDTFLSRISAEKSFN